MIESVFTGTEVCQSSPSDSASEQFSIEEPSVSPSEKHVTPKGAQSGEYEYFEEAGFKTADNKVEHNQKQVAGAENHIAHINLTEPVGISATAATVAWFQSLLPRADQGPTVGSETSTDSARMKPQGISQADNSSSQLGSNAICDTEADVHSFLSFLNK